MKIEVSARTEDRPRCVYCRDDVAPAELDECPGCRTTLHVACRAELERCPTAGCADARVVVAPVDPGADPADERRRRREAARARREAEDRALSARARARGERTQRVVERARARSEADRPWPGLHRPEGAAGIALWLGLGAFFGMGLGFFIALMASRHGLEAAQVARWVPGATLVGLLEACSLALFGIRKEPLVRVSYTSGKGSSRRHHDDAAPLVIGCLVAAALAGAWLGHLLAAGPGLLVGAIAGPLVALGPVLRWLGWD